MKFSIVIACYNLGSLVSRAIDSCINQHGIHKVDYEIIAINDGSTDDTLSYINNYKDVQNLRIIDKPNSGLSGTRNLGIDLSKGTHILFLDGDDWLRSDALMSLSDYAAGFDIVAFPMIYYYSDSSQVVRLNWLKQGEYPCSVFLRETLGRMEFNIIPAQKKIYKKSFLVDNNIRFVEGILHEDNPFFLQVMNYSTTIFFLNKPLYYYLQQRTGSITSQHTLKNFHGVIAGIEYIEKFNISKNKDVSLLNANMLVYQATQSYTSKSDMISAFQILRSIKCKCRIIKYLFSERFDFLHTVRLLMLLIDPIILKKIYHKL